MIDSVGVIGRIDRTILEIGGVKGPVVEDARISNAIDPARFTGGKVNYLLTV